MASDNPFQLGKNRIEALSDGVFAIAMTILVLGFKLPALPPSAPNVQVAPAIVALWPVFLSYSVAFISLGVYWILHHMVYHSVRSADRTLLWLNILFFLFISVLPFCVQLMNQFSRAQVAPALFGGNLAIAGWLLWFQWIYALAHPEMMAEHFSKEYKEAVGLRVILAPIAATLTSLICFWSVSTSLLIYVLLLPFYFLPTKVERRRRSGRGDMLPERVGWLSPGKLLAIGGVLAVGVGWYLFRPESLLINSRVNENGPMKGAIELYSGQFKGLAHETVGTAEILDVAGKRLLRFTGFSTSNGPDVHVYLVAATDASSDDTVRHAGFINLGKMKGNQGDQNYELPPDVDLTRYRSVSLWCQRFNVNFAACSFQ